MPLASDDRRGGPTFTGPSLTETHTRRCPHCCSGAIVMAPGHILADASGMIRIEYRCRDCTTPFWLLQYLTLGLAA